MTFCHATAGNVAKFRTHGRTDGRTDGWTDKRGSRNSYLDNPAKISAFNHFDSCFQSILSILTSFFMTPFKILKNRAILTLIHHEDASRADGHLH